MPSDDRLQQYARQLLQLSLESISEECYCAGWLNGLETDIWWIVQTGPTPYGQGQVSQADIDRLKQLAEDAGGWFEWVDGAPSNPTFVPLAEWLPFAERRMELRRQWKEDAARRKAIHAP